MAEIELGGKSYATKDNLRRAIAKAGLTEKHHMLVRDDEGRYRAVFWGVANDAGMPLYIANKGFMVVG